MNNTLPVDQFYEKFIKNFISVALGLIINFINGTFVMVFFKNTVFHNDPRYILYIHLVINDMILLSFSVGLQVTTYVLRAFNVSICCAVLCFLSILGKNTPLNLACMAIERYIAICKPLHHLQICTVRRTYMLICFIWTASALPALSDIFIAISIQTASFFSSFNICHRVLVYNSWEHNIKETVVNVVYLSFVWISLIITYFNVLSAANAASADRASAKKGQNTILLHAVQLLLCMMSYVTPVVSSALVERFPESRTTILFMLFLLTNILPRLLSPLIYGLRDQKFLEHIKVFYCCKRVRTPIIPMKKAAV